MVVSKTDYKTNIKNALVVTLIYSLKNPTSATGIYKKAKEILEEYTEETFSYKEIDEFSRELLLTDDKLEKILRRSTGVGKGDKIDKFGFSTIYLILNNLERIRKEYLRTKEYVRMKSLKLVPKSSPDGLGALTSKQFRNHIQYGLPKNRKRHP